MSWFRRGGLLSILLDIDVIIWLIVSTIWGLLILCEYACR